MMLSEEAVFEKLKNVIDPELFVNVVDLGLIYGVKLKPGGPHLPAQPPATRRGLRRRLLRLRLHRRQRQ